MGDGESEANTPGTCAVDGTRSLPMLRLSRRCAAARRYTVLPCERGCSKMLALPDLSRFSFCLSP
jgi:hypothetical protein